MDLRGKLSKIKGSLGKAGSSGEGLSPVEVMEDLDFSDSFRVAAQKDSARSLPTKNPERAAEVIASIAPEYYTADEDFDPSLEELRRLPDALDVNELNQKRQEMKEQVSVVCKRMSALILEKHPSYSAELSKVAGVEKSLCLALETAQTARAELAKARRHTSETGLGLVGRRRKLDRLRALLGELERIRTIAETELRLRELIEDGDYVRGIQLCRECGAAAEAFRRFSCVGDVELKLKGLLGGLEEELGRAAATLTLSFDEGRFHHLASALALLGKPPLDATWLLEHSLAGLHDAAQSLLATRFPDSASSSASSPEHHPEPLPSPSEEVDPAETIRDLGVLLWRILWSYHSIVVYATSVLGDEKEAELLKQGIPLIWKAAADEMRAGLARAGLPSLQFSQFLRVLQTVAIFTRVGRIHFGSDSADLHESLVVAARAYLKTYHRSRMEELKAFIDSEAWEPCPLPANFSISKLPELGFLQRSLPPDEAHESTAEGSEQGWSLMRAEATNPFHQARREEREGAAADLHDYDSDAEAETEAVDEDAERGPREPAPLLWLPAADLPVLQCNASLNLLRLVGRYMELGWLLPSLGLDVVVGLAQLFDYFFYAVGALFGRDWAERGGWTREAAVGPGLAATLRRLDNTFDGGGGALTPASFPGLGSSDGLYALPARVVAVESLVRAAAELASLQPRLETLVPPEKRVFLSQLSQQTLALAPAMRTLVYGCVGTKAVNFTYLSHAVEKDVNWAVEELLSQHSRYVEYLVEDLRSFSLRLEAVGRLGRVPAEAYEALWGTAVEAVGRALVEGFSKARRCSAEGRALMQLDWQQFLRSLQGLTRLRPLPATDLVDAYIKAYYVPEAQMEQWLRDHPEYSAQQVQGLLHQATHISRKTRQRLAQQTQPTNNSS